MYLNTDFVFTVKKEHGHKWLHVDWSSGLRSADICIDGWFTFAHDSDISCNTCHGWLSVDKFSYSIDSVGNYIMHLPTCFGYHSTRNGRYLTTGAFHSLIVVRPHFLEMVKSYIF